MVLNRHWVKAYENGEIADPDEYAVALYEYEQPLPDPVPVAEVAGHTGWEYVYGEQTLDGLTETELIDLADWCFAEGACLEYEMGAVGGVFTEMKALAAFREELDTRLTKPVETYV